jgi:hypothetical protein
MSCKGERGVALVLINGWPPKVLLTRVPGVVGRRGDQTLHCRGSYRTCFCYKFYNDVGVCRGKN